MCMYNKLEAERYILGLLQNYVYIRLCYMLVDAERNSSGYMLLFGIKSEEAFGHTMVNEQSISIYMLRRQLHYYYYYDLRLLYNVTKQIDSSYWLSGSEKWS